MQEYPEFKDKKVLIFGLGLNDGGLGMAEFFLKQGSRVTITDGKTKEELEKTLLHLKPYEDQIVYHLGGHIKEDFLENDIIVRNPAIKPDNEWLKIAIDNGKQIEMEMSLFHRLAPCKIIGITGTRGKSTTTTLVYEFLKKHFGEIVMLGGNIGKSAIRELPSLNENNIAVLELSSFQLDTMGKNHLSSPIAVTTNMYIDHQNWHSGMQDYIDAKKSIFKYQNESGILVTNVDNEITKTFKEEAKGKVISFSLIDNTADYFMDKNSLTVYENGQLLVTIHDLILDGEHNLYNILGAIATARTQGVNTNEIQEVLSSFKGVSGREEFIKELNGVKYYNDTTATSAEAMIAMFDRFGSKYKGKIVMIAGGVDKGLEYGAVTQMMKENLKALVLLEGTASEKMAEQSSDVEVYKYYNNLEAAVLKAQSLATTGDMIILCPGGASFNMFANEFDRGDQFVNLVNNLK